MTTQPSLVALCMRSEGTEVTLTFYAAWETVHTSAVAVLRKLGAAGWRRGDCQVHFWHRPQQGCSV